MKMTKLLKWYSFFSTDPVAQKRDWIEKSMFIVNMNVDGKTDMTMTFGRIEDDKFFREIHLRDQDTVDEFVEFLKQLEQKYGTKIIKIEVRDL